MHPHPKRVRSTLGAVALVGALANACIRPIELAELTDASVDPTLRDASTFADVVVVDSGNVEVSLQFEASLLVDAEGDATDAAPPDADADASDGD